MLIERCIIRFLYGRPLETLLATWGLSLVLQQAVRSIFGATNREVGTPSWMSGSFKVGQLDDHLRTASGSSSSRCWCSPRCWRCCAARRSACTCARSRRTAAMAAAMGIRTPWVDALTFGLGSGIAGIAGVALSQIDNVSPNLGQGYIIDSFMVVVFGGVGNLWGTLVGALTLGIVNKFLEPYRRRGAGQDRRAGLLILFIQRRPRGLFPLKGRAVECMSRFLWTGIGRNLRLFVLLVLARRHRRAGCSTC